MKMPRNRQQDVERKMRWADYSLLAAAEKASQPLIF